MRDEYNFRGGVRGKYAKRFTPLLVALFALGCVDSLSPSEVAGRYELERVRNNALPISWTGPADEPRNLLSGHLILFADGSAEEVMNFEQPVGPGSPRVVVQRTYFRYELDGARLTLWVPTNTSEAVAFSVPSTFKRQLRFLGDVLVDMDGLHYVRSEISTQ